MSEKEFTDEEKEIFRILVSNTHQIVRNKINRTFLETAISQNSTNLDFILQNSKMANRKNLWAITKALKDTKIKKQHLGLVFEYYGYQSLVGPSYQSKLDKYLKSKSNLKNNS